MTSNRQDFTSSVRGSLAHRAGYACSSPLCRAPTAGPSDESAHARSDVGVAAHITAAAPGGPRYDETLSEAERTSATNGIWLCQVCAKKVDDDETTFSVSLLRQWKQYAEADARERLGRPNQPAATGALVRDPLEQMIAHRMRDALIAATSPMAAMLARTANANAFGMLSRLMLAMPPGGPYSRDPDVSIARPLTAQLMTPRLLEPAVDHDVPPGIRWIDWIISGLHQCGVECGEALRLYAPRGPNVLIAQFEELNRHMPMAVHSLSSLASRIPGHPWPASERSYFEETLRVLVNAQRTSMKFLLHWQTKIEL
ncbi:MULTISPECIES: hypothetical protein [Sorangium]|uniref:HNH endonuclease n=1 Tax=Sorangium cellulosum TaxID=56 RepID=A0A4P2QY65_SORCE|nr:MULTISPECIES: hypothetical protein [Sorangium]AUX35489.1 uncharacterized protein SOCE836_076820 [Sorangium cellulosum]WCQ94790.1 hypothetical protein NQZ70_07560 [Sorangium sp. Soce836]